MSKDASVDGTPRSSHLSVHSTLSPTWAPPKSPLPPHRLAKLANALGVSTPMPAIHQPAPLASSSYSGPTSPLDPYRRSPTPSAASNNSYSPSTSKYLLHVIPPTHLPHESDSNTTLTPPPSNASGYHTQFRRGTLVPVYSTLQSQLGAIAKEYALPGTSGLLLYLVSTPSSQSTQSTTPEADMQDPGEPGPRLSEEIWKHLWTRVLKAEQREDGLLPPSRSITPNTYGTNGHSHSTPELPQPLRPLIINGASAPNYTSGPIPYPITPSTPSTTSDMRSVPKSAGPSSSSVSLSEPETPDTSTDSHSFMKAGVRANSLDLPGLHSSSFIPILAKVEFDIDRRRAAWYEPWIRSRKVNQAKRIEGRKASFGPISEGGEGPKRAPIDLLTGRKQTASPLPFTSPSEEHIESGPEGYQPLSDSLDDALDPDETHDDSEEEEPTARITSILTAKDPLADVFGSDADTWADMRDSQPRESKRLTNPGVVPLALTGADLTILPTSESDEDLQYPHQEEDEVQKLLDQMSRPSLSVAIPLSPPKGKRSSSPTGQSKRHVPPPLVLLPLPSQNETLAPSERSPLPSSSSSVGTRLPYLSGTPDGMHDKSSDDDGEQNFTRVRSPEESEKRGGTIFDDLDLGLDPTVEFDDNDPHDRRRSQYVMKAQLDEIERTLAQLSPRILKTDLEEDQSLSFTSASLSPGMTTSRLTLSPGGMRNADVFPPSPRLPSHPEFDSSEIDGQESHPRGVWPAVPFSSLNEPVASSTPPSRQAGLPPSPPRLAVNGITTSAPRSFNPTLRSSNEMSAESQSRRRELENEQLPYPSLNENTQTVPSTSSPIIPLSPDPFGRYSSTPEGGESSRQSQTYWEPNRRPVQAVNSFASSPIETPHRKTSGAGSRFSADSITEVEAPTTKTSNRATLSVKTIKNLWRKSGKNAATPTTPTHTMGRASPQLHPSQERAKTPPLPSMPLTPTFGQQVPQPPPPRPERPHDQLDIPSSQYPPQGLAVPFANGGRPLPSPNAARPLAPPSAIRPLPSPITAAQMQPRGSNLDRFHFDQESPYPIRRSPYPSRPSSPVAPEAQPPFPDREKPSGTRKSILKSWKGSIGGSSGSTSAPSVPEPPRSSLDRPGSASGNRPRRPSVLNFGSSRVPSGSPPPEIPPSPQVPEHFVRSRNSNASGSASVHSASGNGVYSNGMGYEHQRQPSGRSHLTASSVDLQQQQQQHSPPQGYHQHLRSPSPQRSMASSRDSGETRPSFDASQFEIVSPKMGSALSYPYHSLDHD